MYDFEIHITTTDLKEAQINAFESFCISIEAKPIVIELSKGKYYRQPMISKVVKCQNKEELEKETAKVQNSFFLQNYEVLRTKIEVPLWDKEFVQYYYKDISKTYFEWHGKVQLSQKELIVQLCEKQNARLSRNTLKNDPSKKFITIRDYESEAVFKQRINDLKQDLSNNNISLIKEEFEFCLFDSNESLDKGWIL